MSATDNKSVLLRLLISVSTCPRQIPNSSFHIVKILVVLCMYLVGCDQISTVGHHSNQAYQRIEDTRVLRAGYIAYPPSCIVDPRTGEVTGIFVDILDRVASNLGWELELVEEAGWGTMIQGLSDGRYDIMASASWANPVRGKLTTMSSPVYFSALGVWVRADDNRFDINNYRDRINRSDIRIAAMDGSTPAVVAREDFPTARLVTYPDLTGEPQLFLDLVGGKVDVFFAEPAVAGDFLQTNPGTIKNVGPASPVRVFANVYLMAANEPRLKHAIDVALRDLQTSGFVESMIDRYAGKPAVFYSVAQPYGNTVP